MRTVAVVMHAVWRDPSFRAALALALVLALILVAVLATSPVEMPRSWAPSCCR